METVKMTCIVCPRGCDITVEIENGEVLNISGNACDRGLEYARNEAVNPVRTLTSTVAVINGVHPRVSVKTEKEIPKGKMMECAKALKGVVVEAPVKIGDVVLEDVVGTGVNIVATINIEKK